MANRERAARTRNVNITQLLRKVDIEVTSLTQTRLKSARFQHEYAREFSELHGQTPGVCDAQRTMMSRFFPRPLAEELRWPERELRARVGIADS
jgi:hypothetical protein